MEDARPCIHPNLPALSDWEGLHGGDHCVVAGLGASTADFVRHASNYWTIGVNDIGHLFVPDYLVLLDRYGRFPEDRRRGLSSELGIPRATFQPYSNPADLVPGHLHVNFAFGGKFDERSRKPLEELVFGPAPISGCGTTTFAATVIAVRMGFTRIGVVGMDLSDEYAWGQSLSKRKSSHPLRPRARAIAKAFNLLCSVAKERGVTVLNLSDSRVCDWGAKGDLDAIGMRKGGMKTALGNSRSELGETSG